MASPPLSETYALVDLYQSTNGDNWQWKQNYSKNGYPWNVTDWPNQNPCSAITPWQGVACTEKTSSERSITTLQLVAYGLRGKLQPSIGNLTSLETFDLSLNHLFGLAQVVEFYLYNNQLSGTISSSEVGMMSKVEYFELYNNQFTGIYRVYS